MQCVVLLGLTAIVTESTIQRECEIALLVCSIAVEIGASVGTFANKATRIPNYANAGRKLFL